MSESNSNRESAPVLANAGVGPANVTSYRSAVPSAAPAYVTAPVAVPVIPHRPDFMMGQNQNYGMNQGYGMGSYGGMGGMGSYGMGGMGTMGGYGGYGMGGYGGYGMGGMGMGMNSQNPYGYGNIESRFIQMAEENSRPAFETIQSFVHAVGGVSMMLENTFFAMTSSFRAILGVAENFGRLRSLFAQFWTTFGMIRSINWLIRKLMVMLGIRTEDEFKAWAEAVAATQDPATPGQPRSSSWPVLLFFAVVAAAPYLVLKMMNTVTSSTETSEDAAVKKNAKQGRPDMKGFGLCTHGRPLRFRKQVMDVNDPRTWIRPLTGVAQHSFQANSSQELSFNEKQVLKIAPQALQGQMWNSGWLVATADGVTPGMVPVNHIKIIPENANTNHKPEDKQLHCSLST